MPSVLQRLLKEPLLHFAVLGLLIFAAFSLLTPKSVAPPPSAIVVTAAQIDQMVTLFAKTWQRPPNAAELKGLIDDRIAEEVFFRQALALGLEKDDSVIRRRLRQKMEFMTDAEVEALKPTDADLQGYLDAHAADYQVDPQVAFEQVFLSRDRRGDALHADAAALLAQLVASPDSDTSALGDPSLRPPSQPLTPVSQIGSDFGPEFTAALEKAPTGVWSGPIASSYGLHIVRVTGRQDGRTPLLAEVREAVLRDWSNAERQRLGKAELDKMKAAYTITVEPYPASGNSP